jgi:GTPase SAR1 family protein
VVLVYDVSSVTSFENAGRWLEEAKNLATNENIEIILVGNKSDLHSKYDNKDLAVALRSTRVQSLPS